MPGTSEELAHQCQDTGEVFIRNIIIPPEKDLAQPLQYSVLLQSAQSKVSKKGGH